MQISTEELTRRVRSTARQMSRVRDQVLDPAFTRQLATTGLGVVKKRARRRDLIGEAAYRALWVAHGGLGTAGRSLSRLAEASEPPARGGKAATRTAPAPRRRPGTRRDT